MSSLDLIATARNDEFASRVLFLATTAAQQVAAEDPGATDHVVRANYAGRVIRGSDNPKMIATHVISSNPTIQATINANPQNFGSDIPDGDIEYALASIWTARALAFEGVPG